MTITAPAVPQRTAAFGVSEIFAATNGQLAPETSTTTPVLGRFLGHLNDEVNDHGSPTRLPALDANGARMMPP